MRPARSRRFQRAAAMQFGAPLSREVRVITGAVLVLFVVMLVGLPLAMPARARWAAFLGPGILLLVFISVGLFCVRGYTLRPRELLIQRSFWQTAVSLRDLQAAWIDPQAMRSVLRKAGNGGFLGFTGWFWTKRLGGFRAYVTDRTRCVVLEFRNGKIVVSPDDPERFVQALGLDSGGTGGRH